MQLDGFWTGQQTSEVSQTLLSCTKFLKCSFRHFWASLPWQRATFHTLSPDAVADLGSHILNADRAVLELLHALDWAPVLRQLAHVSAPDARVSREGCSWATQLACLAMRAFILLRPSELPLW